MIDLDPAAINAGHEPKHFPTIDRWYCFKCGQYVNEEGCEPYRLAAELVALREQVQTVLGQHPHSDPCASSVNPHCVCWHADLEAALGGDQPKPEADR